MTGWWFNGRSFHWLQDGRSLCGQAEYFQAPWGKDPQPKQPGLTELCCRTCVRLRHKQEEASDE